MTTITTAQAQYLTSLVDGLPNPADANTADGIREEIAYTLRAADDYKALRAELAAHRPTMGRDEETGKVVFTYSAEGQAAKAAIAEADAQIAAQVETILAEKVARYAELKSLDVQSLSKDEASAIISELKN